MQMPDVQTSDLEQQLVNDLYDFRFDPLGCVLYSFPWLDGELKEAHGPRSWQREQLQSLRDHLSNPATRFTPYLESISSGHGIGKSADVSFIIHWALSCWEDARVVVTANTGDQLATKTVPEAKKWFRRAINTHWFDPKSEFIKVKDPLHKETWRADFVTWSIERTEAFAGLHNEGRIIVLIFDEASAIPDKIWEVAEGAMTDENTVIIWLAFGNPTKNTGRFRECFGKFAHRWKHRQIDSRTVEGTNKEQLNKWIEDYGEDSDFCRVRIRGEFPRAGSTQFIPADVVAAARKAHVEVASILPKIGACDVARFGDDESIIGDRQGRRGRIWKCFRGLDTVELAERCIEYIDAEKPDAFVVDGDGIGAGVFDYIKHRGYDRKTLLVEFHGGHTPTDPIKYFNKRAEVWGEMRDWLQTAQIPDDPELDTQLTSVEYGYTNKGQIQLEKKDDMKKRGLSSPDRGDMLAMTFGVKVAPKFKPAEEQVYYGSDGWMA
jgi:hypothetical protein